MAARQCHPHIKRASIVCCTLTLNRMNREDEREADRAPTRGRAMTRNKNDTHRHDPRWIFAKSSGIDAHGRRFGKGERVLYYPVFHELVSGARAEEASLISIVNILSAA